MTNSLVPLRGSQKAKGKRQKSFLLWLPSYEKRLAYFRRAALAAPLSLLSEGHNFLVLSR
jgi:hypothetical protein